MRILYSLTHIVCSLIMSMMISCIYFGLAQASESLPVTSGRATAQLVSSHDAAAPGQDIHIALSLRLEPHWHTYWRNAGGPGEPADIYWDLPDTLSAGEIIWPLPKIVSTGPIINYAFEDRVLLPMVLHISPDAKPGDVLTIKAQAAYLVCYQVCLPESANLSLPLVIGEEVIDRRWSGNIDRTLARAPKPENLAASATLKDETLFINIKSGKLALGALKNPYFFPYEQDVIDASAPQIVQRGQDGIGFALSPGFVLEDDGIKDVQGVLAFEQKTQTEDGTDQWQRRGIVVTAKAGKPIDIGLKPATAQGTSLGLLASLLAAFVGGMILNLMPCVFPVLSLKALGFARAAHEDKNRVRAHGWYYTLGVILSFLLLASALLVLKASGAGIGWGFQLQNPVLVGLLAILFFAIALNLFGLFEFGGSLQNTGAELTQKDGAKGAFFTGVLAVIVATPCTAPFMAGAIGFAFTQTGFVTLLVFFALAAGFALPFLALSYAPGLLHRLPKPGAWMETFKQLLGFPMLAASIWLLWVLTIQAGAGGVVRALSSMLLFGFAIWVWTYKGLLARIFLAVSVLLGGYLIYDLGTAGRAQELKQTPEAQNWSPERVAELRAQGYTVFVDFTAAWCVSCKVNESLVLGRQATQDLFARANTKVLVAGWTSRDANITAELARHGRSGVPVYLVYPPGNTPVSPEILPQILSFNILENALLGQNGKAKQD